MDFLRSRGLEFQIVPESHLAGIEMGAYLCKNFSGDPHFLTKYPHKRSEWRGVVSVETLRLDTHPVAEEQLTQWGEYALVYGRFLFYGDPAFIQAIRSILSSGNNNAKIVDPRIGAFATAKIKS